MHKMLADDNSNITLENNEVSFQPSQFPTYLVVAFRHVDPHNITLGDNSNILYNNLTNTSHSPSESPTVVIPSGNLTSLTMSAGFQATYPSSSSKNYTSQPSLEPTGSPAKNISDSINRSNADPSNWYDYWSSSKPSAAPTHQPTSEPTPAPSNEVIANTPTAAPSRSSKVGSSGSNNQNYELISSMTVLVTIMIIAAALYMTKRHLIRKRKSKTKVVIQSPFFCEISKRMKERKKLMEEYFEVDAAECTILHRSAASSIDLQISTEFIDISRENQQSIY